MKKLTSKPCKICQTPVFGIKRKDRNSYYYSNRCSSCRKKVFDPELKAKKIALLQQYRKKVPIGTKRLHKTGNGLVYWVIKVQETGKWPYEHRVITNAKPHQHVHHINGDTLDNRPENLKLVTPKEHKQEHKLQQWAKKFVCCVNCGTSKKQHMSNGLCSTCYQRNEVKDKFLRKPLALFPHFCL